MLNFVQIQPDLPMKPHTLELPLSSCPSFCPSSPVIRRLQTDRKVDKTTGPLPNRGLSALLFLLSSMASDSFNDPKNVWRDFGVPYVWLSSVQPSQLSGSEKEKSHGNPWPTSGSNFSPCVTARSAYPSLESLSRHSKKSDASSCAVSLSLTSSPHIRSKAPPIFGSCFDVLTNDECEAFRRLDRMLKWMYSSFCRTSWSQNLEDKLMDPSRSLGHIFSFALVFSKNLTLHRISLSTSLF